MAKRKPVTLATLRAAPSDSILYCDTCGGEYSATVGDYSFWKAETEPFKCCGRLNRLVIKQVRLIEVP